MGQYHRPAERDPEGQYRLAATAETPAAALALEQNGLNPAGAASLPQAMAAAKQGRLATVISVRAGRVVGSHRAMLFQSGDAAWLAIRASQESQQFIVERSQASAVAAFVSEAVSGLAQAKEPVP